MMKMLKMSSVLLLVLWSGVALAQHSHGAAKGPNGGKMEDIAGLHAELVISGATITLNVFDEKNKPVDTAGFTASVQVSVGGARETLQLAPAGTALKGEAKAPLAGNATYNVVLRTAAGKSGQARF